MKKTYLFALSAALLLTISACKDNGKATAADAISEQTDTTKKDTVVEVVNVDSILATPDSLDAASATSLDELILSPKALEITDKLESKLQAIADVKENEGMKDYNEGMTDLIKCIEQDIRKRPELKAELELWLKDFYERKDSMIKMKNAEIAGIEKFNKTKNKSKKKK